MSSPTTQFLIFCIFNACCLAGGILARKKRLVSENFSRPLHFYTIAISWSVVGFLSLWQLPQTFANLWLLALEPFLVIVPAFAAMYIAKAMGAERKHIGLMAVGAGLGNLGFTLGAYLCYTFFSGQHIEGSQLATQGDAALAYAIAQVTIMANLGIIFLYPVARHFGESGENDESVGVLIFRSLVDLRAMPLYTAIAGTILAYLAVPFPDWIRAGHLIDVLFYLGGFGGYFGIGLRIYLGRNLFEHKRYHILLAGMKFVFLPLLTIGLLAGANLSSYPPPVLAGHTMMLLAFMPTAIQMVIIANLFNLDGRFASGAWLVSTALFVVLILPVLLVFYT